MTDFVSVLEAAYRLEVPDDDWLSGLLDATAPALDCGMGQAAYLFAGAPRTQVRVLSARGTGPYAEPGVLDKVMSWALAAPPEFLETMIGRTVFETVSMRMGRARFGQAIPEFVAIDPQLGALRDQFGLAAVEPGRFGCVVSADLPRRTTVSRQDKALWERIAAHIGSAMRLRRRAHAAPEAILSPGGRIEHATDAAQSKLARESLMHAARVVDRARGALRRRSPEEAIAIWTALAAGRWSLVDHFDTDGRRYVIARRNEPEAEGWAQLTPGERNVVAFAAMGHSNKLVGYELGITPSTVAMRLARAMRKLGAMSRVALIDAYKRHAATADKGEA